MTRNEKMLDKLKNAIGDIAHITINSSHDGHHYLVIMRKGDPEKSASFELKFGLNNDEESSR